MKHRNSVKFSFLHDFINLSQQFQREGGGDIISKDNNHKILTTLRI